jgi:hypothetical protein
MINITGEKRFSFDAYVKVHQEVYQDLRQNDEFIPEGKRVRDLLQDLSPISEFCKTKNNDNV